MLKSGYQVDAVYEDLWRTIRRGKVWHGELVNRRKDETLYNEEMQITPVRAGGGEIVSYIAVKRDITERKKTEEAQRLLATIVDSSEDAIIAYSTTGTIRSWNRGARVILGYTAEEVIGKHVSMLVPQDRQAGLSTVTDRVLAGEAVSQYEGICRRKDGEWVHVSVTASPIRNPAGEVEAVSTVLRDITSQRLTNHALEFQHSLIHAIHEVALTGFSS